MALDRAMPSLDRRTFLKQAGLAAAWATGAGAASLAGQAPATDPFVPLARPARPVRIRGRVHAAGSGIARVAVTDGVSVAQTAADGSFTLVASPGQPFVYVTVPGDCEIPRNDAGTARFYRSIAPGDRDEMSVEFALARRRASSERHVFLALPDTQTQDADDMGQLHSQTVPDVQAYVAALQGRPAFGVAVGDIMFDELSLYPEYERAVRAMGIPFFQVVGNHDVDRKARSSELATSTFMRHFGPPYYSFDVGAVHYVVLQDVLWHGTGYVGYVDDRQLQWLEGDLALLEPGRTVVVFLHIPLESRQWRRDGLRAPSPTTSVNNRAAVYALLERFEVHVVSGHTHENEHVFEGGLHEHVHGTVCGAWWTGPICHDGSPSGYGAFDVKGESIEWLYKATGHPAEHQLRLYAPGADLTAPDELVANVWNWDPKWQVEWVADGVRVGPMARRIGRDPLAVQLHTGPDLPKKRTWVEPARTEHLFYAPVGPGTREVQVRATDRFGRTFTETWRRG
jgi:hypothetical protein